MRKRSNGLWEARISVPGGERKSLYGKSCAEVRAKLDDARRRSDQGENITAKKETMASFLERWLVETTRPPVRESTFHAYSNWVRNHLVLPRSDGEIGDLLLTKLSPEDVQKMMAARRARGLSPTSVDHARRIVRIALDQAVAWGLVSRNAAALARPPKRECHEIDPLSVEEVQTLFHETRAHRFGHLFTVAFLPGMRQGVLLALRREDVDLDRAVLRVRATLGRQNGKLALLPPKSEQSRRTLRLSRGCIDAVRDQTGRADGHRLLAGDRWADWNLVFPSSVGTPPNNSNVAHEFQQALSRIGLCRVRFHDLRHSAESFLIASGVPIRLVQDHLGHSGLALTIATYTHISPAMKQEVADAMDPLGQTTRAA